MEIKQVDMTPDMARALLSKNDKNRNPNENAVAKLMAQMQGGKWQLNGDTIVVSNTGRLLDGQHRLTAVMLSGMTVPMLVASGADDAVFDTIDTGKARRAADIVGMVGVRNRHESVAASSAIYRLAHGVGLYIGIPPNYNLVVLERYTSIDGWADRYKHARQVRALIGGGTIIPALVYLSEIAKAPELSARLIDGLDKGVGLASGDPILALRNRLINMKGRKARMDIANLWSLMVRTLDALESGEVVYQIQAMTQSNLQRPKLWKRHMAKLSDEMNLIDLPPPQVLAKIRSQKDIMARVDLK